MANHASAEKRNRQRITRTARNRAARSSLRSTLKKARAAIVGGTDNLTSFVETATSALDRAASKGVIPAKRASRVKSRIAALAHKAAAAVK